MRLRRNAALLMLLATLFSSFAGPMGCADSHPDVKQRSLLGDDAPFYGSLLQKVLSGLLQGAASKGGSAAMGEIMELLGWGGSDDKSALDAMSQKLDQIVSLLGDIESTLESLLQQLNITEEEIIANTNDPSDAITNIKTSHQELQGLADGKDPGTVDQATLQTFVNRVENIYVIDEKINAINDAIIPPDIAKSPVLGNFTDLGINRVAQGKSLTDAYLGVESYFSQLLYYQLEGVNLFVETKIYRKKAGLSQIDGMDAQAYMDFFTKNELQPEVDNFMNNVCRLILSQVDLSDYDHFLPSDAPTILSRANFFRIQSLNEDHFGLRGTLIATQDLVSSVMTINARSRQTGRLYSGTGTLYTVQGVTYDYWTGNAVKGSSDYTVIAYDFGDAAPGDYDILDANGNVIGSATVQTYKDDYTVDASGTIHYGHFVIKKRVGQKDAFNNNAIWSWWNANLQNIGANGSAAARYTGLSGGAQNDAYNGDDELDAHFLYMGSANTGLTIHYFGVHAYGKTHSSSNSDAGGFAHSKIRYTIGIWDATTNKLVHIFNSATKTTPDSGSVGIDDYLQVDWSFPDPSPGHDYYIYFNCHIDGDSYYGNAGGDMTIDGIAGNVYITF